MKITTAKRDETASAQGSAPEVQRASRPRWVTAAVWNGHADEQEIVRGFGVYARWWHRPTPQREEQR